MSSGTEKRPRCRGASLVGFSPRLQSGEMQAAPSPDSRSGFSAIPGFGGQSTQNTGGNSLAVSPNTVNDIEDKVLVHARRLRVGMQ